MVAEHQIRLPRGSSAFTEIWRGRYYQIGAGHSSVLPVTKAVPLITV